MSRSDKICYVGASKSSSDDGVCESETNDMLQNMSTDNKDVVVCANCGKEGDNLKACTACELVKYCNRECQIAHRPQHKKECRKRAAELHDEKLFKQPPPKYGDCPICFIRMPSLGSGSSYFACCGKAICSGCIHAPVYDDQGNEMIEKICPFCRVPAANSEEEYVERLNKRVEAGDFIAIGKLGGYYAAGENGFPQDYTKALELWHRAADLGYARAYCNIGWAYLHGSGVNADKKKSIYYFELAAMGGSVLAQSNLGLNEGIVGNYDRALKHFMIAVRSGNNDSLKNIKELYKCGHATKEDYTKALQAYQAYLGEIKSPQRDKAAAFSEKHRYY